MKSLSKIKNTFFAIVNVKDVGKLGELQLEALLDKLGFSKDLPVGNGTGEFAIKSADDGKWIPIDSKIITPELDVSNEKKIDNVTLREKEVK